MREILKNVHRPAKCVFVIGWIVVAAVVAASTVLYIGAGEIFDYYSAVALSEKLLTSARPISVAVFAASTITPLFTLPFKKEKQFNKLNYITEYQKIKQKGREKV